MKFRFAKMHGLGNDFVVFDAVNQDVQLTSEMVRKIADRKLGVGCDQILVIHPATDADVDFNYQIYNSCLLYTSPSPRDATLSRMPSSA